MNIKKTFRQKLIKLAEKWKEEEILLKDPIHPDMIIREYEKEGGLLLILRLTKATGAGTVYSNYQYLKADQIALYSFSLGIQLQAHYTGFDIHYTGVDSYRDRILKDNNFTDDEIDMISKAFERLLY